MANEKSCWDRLDSVIRWANMNINYFARYIGLSRAEIIYQIKAGRNGISHNLARRIVERFPEVSMGWLLTGEGDMFVGKGMCGTIPFYESVELMCSREFAPTSMLHVPLLTVCDYAYRNSDVAMVPDVAQGAVVFVAETDSDKIIYGGLYVVECANFVLLRRVRIAQSDDLVLAAADSSFGDVVVAWNDVRRMYRVVSVMRMY